MPHLDPEQAAKLLAELDKKVKKIDALEARVAALEAAAKPKAPAK